MGQDREREMNIINIEDFRKKNNKKKDESSEPHHVAELMCLNCFKRWIGIWNAKVMLKDLLCKCGAKGSIIKTGQDLDV